MPLSGEELRRRIVAAAALQGMGMRQARLALEDYEAPKTLGERMVSGKVPQSRRRLITLAETFGMPVEWFEVEDWRDLVAGAPPTGSDLADQARARAARALAQGQKQSQEAPPAKDPKG